MTGDLALLIDFSLRGTRQLLRGKDHPLVLGAPSAAEAKDVVPGLFQGVGRGEIALAQGGAFADGLEDARDGKLSASRML